MLPLIDMFTDNAIAGVIPPPADTAPGSGAPCGGNRLTGGGATAAAAALMEAYAEACSWGSSKNSSEISLTN